MMTDVRISASQMTYIAERVRAAEDATKEAAKLNLIIAGNFLDENTYERYKEYKKITGNMITLTIKHESNRRSDITERTFTTVRETRKYINAVVENMNKAKKWILCHRDAHSEKWASIKGRSMMLFTY